MARFQSVGTMFLLDGVFESPRLHRRTRGRPDCEGNKDIRVLSTKETLVFGVDRRRDGGPRTTCITCSLDLQLYFRRRKRVGGGRVRGAAGGE